MDKLQYRLEGFEGPLDLLLTLIAKNKIDIYDIPIAQLLEQYMEQIDLMREENLDIASEFLEMAARLVHIKTVSLLPKQEEEEDPRLELTGQLLEYQQCKEAAQRLGRQASFDSLTRAPMPLPADSLYKRLHQPRELLQALQAAWGKGKSLLPPKPESFSALVSRKIVSVASQAVFVLRRLWKGQLVTYQGLFAGKRDRSERVALFLAVLELIRSRRIRVEGEGGDSPVRLLRERNQGGEET
ncbi:serine protease [bacterium D16-76]|nr:serine protease [bacterium D16-76]